MGSNLLMIHLVYSLLHWLAELIMQLISPNRQLIHLGQPSNHQLKLNFPCLLQKLARFQFFLAFSLQFSPYLPSFLVMLQPSCPWLRSSSSQDLN
jgi:hypothetical protein